MAGRDDTRLMRLVILHTNDIQDATPDAVSRLAALVAEERRVAKAPCVVLDAGDGFQYFHLMRHIPYDAVALGNEDLVAGALPALTAASTSLRFVGTNVNLRLPGSESSKQPPWCRRIREMRRGGLRVGVLGFTNTDSGFYLSKRYPPSVQVTDPVDAGGDWVSRARERVDLLIALFHGWLPDRERFVRAFPEIDVVISGHDHLVAGYGDVGSTIVGQAHSNVRSLGRLELEIQDGEIRSWHGRHRTITPSRPTHAAVDASIAEAADADPDSEVIAVAAEDFRSDQYWLDIDGHNVNLRSETRLGNWLLDILRAAAGSQIAIQKAWGIHHNLAPGPVRRSKLREIIPYDENLWVLDLSGSQIRAALELSVERSYNNLAFSGMTVTADLTRPRGRRIAEVLVGGEPLQPRRTYTVATSDFLAGGNAGFGVLRQAAASRSLGVTIHEAVLAHLAQSREIHGGPFGRYSEAGQPASP